MLPQRKRKHINASSPLCTEDPKIEDPKPIPLPKVNDADLYALDCKNIANNIIKKITLKRNAPSLIKDIFNSEHNLKVIEGCISQMSTQNSTIVLKTHYTLNCKTAANYDYDDIVNSWLKLLMLHHLKHHVFTRLASIDYPPFKNANGNDVIIRGVAIKAIKDIPESTRVFENMRGNCSLYYPVDISEDNANKFVNGDKNPIKELLNDFFLQLNGDDVIYPVVALGPYAIDMSFFLNHSFDDENVRDDDSEKKCDMSSYITTRVINKNEYLNINYVRFTLDGYGNVNKTKLDNLLKRMPFLKTLEPFKSKYVKGSWFPTEINDWVAPAINDIKNNIYDNQK